MLQIRPKKSTVVVGIVIFIQLLLPIFFIAQQTPLPETFKKPTPFGKSDIVINNNFKLTGGFLQDLVGIRRANIKYDYSNMILCDSLTEKEYLSYQTSKMSSKKAEQFIQAWKHLPSGYMEPNFEKYFNKHSHKMGLKATNYATDSDTTLLVEILKMDPEPHIVGMYPYVTMRCSFVAASGDVIVHFELTAYKGAQGDLELKLGECFRAAGNMLGTKIYRRLKALGVKFN